jgi:hypothetical protein
MNAFIILYKSKTLAWLTDAHHQGMRAIDKRLAFIIVLFVIGQEAVQLYCNSFVPNILQANKIYLQVI